MSHKSSTRFGGNDRNMQAEKKLLAKAVTGRWLKDSWFQEEGLWSGVNE